MIASLLLMGSFCRAQAGEQPQVLTALQAQGLTIMDEFEVGGGLRGFAAASADRPMAVYITSDGHAIVGTRLNSQGETVDQAILHQLASKPLSDMQWAQLEAANSVLDGQADAPRILYTFTDPNCPYCHSFWEAARPWVDAGKVQIHHIMVGIIKQDSAGKAAAILSAADPSAALLEHEQNHAKGGIAASQDIPADILQTLSDNKQLMLSMGFRGTPGIVVRGPDGILTKFSGMPQGNQLEEALGPR
ncbi:thiol:disulfide interchange protein DsbG [Lampropedia aestuarii]